MSDVPMFDDNIVRRTLQFFWLVDYSGSMSGSKIATLNHAVKEAVQDIRTALQVHPEVQVMMRAIKFADSADWHMGPAAVPIENFVWQDLEAGGTTTTASAINMLADELHQENMDEDGYAPVCILLSDGYCTEPSTMYEQAILRLNSIPRGQKAIRLVIAYGNENDYEEQSLLKFVNQPQVGLLKADTPGKLLQYIKWASVTAASNSANTAGGSNLIPHVPGVNMDPPPDAPDDIHTTGTTDVF